MNIILRFFSLQDCTSSTKSGLNIQNSSKYNKSYSYNTTANNIFLFRNQPLALKEYFPQRMFNIFSTYVLKKQSEQQQEKIDNEVDEISKALSNVNLNSDIVNLMDLLADGNNANAAGAAGGDGGGGAIVNVAAPNVNNV